MRWEETYVRVVTQGGHYEFFDRFVRTSDVSSLVIVSPWIHFLTNEFHMFEAILEKIRREGIATTVVIRDPKKEPFNYEAAELIQAMPSAALYYNNELHAKVYVCKCPPHGFALVGSANLSGRATHAFEVGVMVEGKGEGCRIVDELERLGTLDLLGRAGTFPAPKEG